MQLLMLCLKRRRGLISLKDASKREKERRGSFLTVIRGICNAVSHFYIHQRDATKPHKKQHKGREKEEKEEREMNIQMTFSKRTSKLKKKKNGI